MIIKLKIVSAPKEKSVYILMSKNIGEPAFVGMDENGIDYACGNCNDILLQNVNIDSLHKSLQDKLPSGSRWVYKCPRCGASSSYVHHNQ